MVNIKQHTKEGKLSIKVVPNASRTKLIEENNELKLYLKAQPQKGKANSELVQFFKKEYKLKVEVIKGKTSRNKVLYLKE